MLDLMFDFLIDMLFFMPLIIKRRWELSKEWSGTAEKKEAHSVPTLSRFRYSVIFRTDKGKTKRLRMKKADFDRYLEGQRYQKKAGTYLPGPYLS